MSKQEQTDRSETHWKRKAAMAIGLYHLKDASDDELDAALDDHIQRVYADADKDGGEGSDTSSTIRNGMPPGPASLANSLSLSNEDAREVRELPEFRDERQKAVYLEGLISETMQRQGVTRERAIRYIETMWPDLFPAKKLPFRSPEEIQASNERQNEVMQLVNEKQKDYADLRDDEAYDKAFAHIRLTRPDLFPGERPKI